MSDLTQEQVIEYLSGLTVMDIVKLTETLEEKWGVKAAPVAAAVAAPAADGGGDAGGEEQTEFTVILKSFGNKMAAIKAVKEITGEGLKQCKELVEGAPSEIKAGISKEAAQEIADKLKAAEAEVEIK